jgi:WD40 repeat protein
MPSEFDAFVSYGHADDGGIARQLQSGVERFAKPWYRARALRLFLDSNNLSANPGLWSSIETALANSSWFVLVTSPGAAGSKWVEREIRWWLQHRSAERLLIVVASGSLSWDAELGDFDPRTSTALPPALLGAFDEEPRWVVIPGGVNTEAEPTELDLRETVIDVATAIRGVSKEELASAAAKEHQRTRRLIRGVIAGLTALLAVAVVAGLIAMDQRDTARDQARLALSRQLASASQAAATTNLDVGMLLAVQAYRQDANSETRAALFTAGTTSPHLVRFLDAGAKVEQVASSSDGRSVVAGLADGRVLLWPRGEGEPQELFQLSRRISSLGIDSSGSVVVASDKAKGMMWRRDHPVAELSVPIGQHVDAVAVSPSGETVAFHGNPPVYEGLDSLTVASVSDPDEGVIHQGVWQDWGVGNRIVMPSDQKMLLFDPGYGTWEWWRIDGWSLERGSSAGFGARQYGGVTSTDGSSFTVTNGGSQVPVWQTSGPTPQEAAIEVEVPLADQNVLALSPDGSKLAVAGGGGKIYVAPVLNEAESQEQDELEGEQNRPLELTGENASVLSFAGDSTHLLSASGTQVGVWDLEQLDRLAQTSKVPLNLACTACGSARLAVSPDGERVAVSDGDGRGGFVQSLADGTDRERLPESELLEFTYSQPMWGRDGEFVAFPFWGGEEPISLGLPEKVETWQGGNVEDRYLADAIAADGESALVLTQGGDLYRRELETGEELDLYSASSGEIAGETLEGATISASPELLAVLVEGDVVIESLPEREVVKRIDGDYIEVAFSGDRLLLQRRDGRLEVWDKRGYVLQRTLPGDENFVWQPIANPDGTLVARRSTDGTIALDDLETGARLATLGTPGNSVFYRTGIAFSPDGSRLVAVSEVPDTYKQGELTIRSISDQNLITAACRAAGRDLTRAEWDTFVGGIDPPADLSCGN